MAHVEIEFPKVGRLISQTPFVVMVGEHDAGAKRTQANVDLVLLAGIVCLR